MPINYQIDPVKRIVFTTASGIVTGAELIAIQAELRVDPAFDPNFGQLVDLSAVDGFAAPEETIHYLAAVRLFHAGAPRAIVATKEISIEGAERYQHLTQKHGENMRVFRDRAVAQSWLESTSEAPERSRETSS